jgi:para-nitrobenzyl esterase
MNSIEKRPADPSIVETTTGPILGRHRNGVHLFAGVPYAAPPVGKLRFRAPAPHPRWLDVRETRRFGAAAPQLQGGGMTDSAPVSWNEDCLTLNIQTPALDGRKRPVLFWIHGGAYRTGQGAIPWYNGESFCLQGDIVVVSINYRLGALGFTDLSSFGSEFASSGVNGTLDQIAALNWTRANIERFGGDPDRITVAGESAGGFSVTTLLANPLCQDSIHAAIPQSGAGQHTLPPAAGTMVADHLLRALEADSPLSVEACSVEDILNAQAEVTAALEGRGDFGSPLGVPVSAFYPVHGNRFIPESPLDAIRKGMGSKARVMIGSNEHETTLWGYGRVDQKKLETAATALHAARPLAAWREVMPDATPEQLLIALTTDHMFRIPAIRVAEARATQNQHTWMYLFAWKSRAFDGRLGATHALEIPFAFNNLRQPGVPAFLGAGVVPQHVADEMHAAWSRFIQGNDPGWAQYSLEQRATRVFDDVSRTDLDPGRITRLAWEGLR